MQSTNYADSFEPTTIIKTKDAYNRECFVERDNVSLDTVISGDVSVTFKRATECLLAVAKVDGFSCYDDKTISASVIFAFDYDKKLKTIVDRARIVSTNDGLSLDFVTELASHVVGFKHDFLQGADEQVTECVIKIALLGEITLGADAQEFLNCTPY